MAETNNSPILNQGQEINIKRSEINMIHLSPRNRFIQTNKTSHGRGLLVCLGIILLAGTAGCNHTRWNIFNKEIQTPLPKEVPTTTALVEYLNSNSKLLTTMRCDDVRVTCKTGIHAFPLDAKLVGQQPRNFRMTATFLGKAEVDLGSNDQEFWYWIRRGDRAQIYCSYDDLDQGKARVMPFPFQPDWVLSALGMGEYGPAEKYKLKVEGDKIHLIERTKSPQGKAVQKVIVFNRRRAIAPTPQVTDFLLIDEATGKEICSAHIRSTQVVRSVYGDKQFGATLPKKMELSWPEQNLTLSLSLDNPEPNVQIPPNFPAFVRQPLDGFPSFNLAQGRFDSNPTSIRRVGGYPPR